MRHRDTANRVTLNLEQRKNTCLDINRNDVVFAEGEASYYIRYTTDNKDDPDFALTAVYNHAAKLVDDCKNALILSGKLDGEALKTEREEI